MGFVLILRYLINFTQMFSLYIHLAYTVLFSIYRLVLPLLHFHQLRRLCLSRCKYGGGDQAYSSPCRNQMYQQHRAFESREVSGSLLRSWLGRVDSDQRLLRLRGRFQQRERKGGHLSKSNSYK